MKRTLSMLKTSSWALLIACLFSACAGDPDADFPGDPDKCYFIVKHTSLNGHSYPIEFDIYEGTSIGWPTVYHYNDEIVDTGSSKLLALPKNTQYYFSFTHHPLGLQTEGCVDSKIDIINPDGNVIIDTRYKSFCYDNNRWAIGGINLHHGCETRVTHPFAEYDEDLNLIEKD